VKEGPLSSIYNQQQVGNGTNKYFTAQTDYTLPFGEKSKFETGLRAAIRNIYNLNDIDTVNAQNQYVVEGLLSSQYNYRDRVFAGYATYSNAIKNFSYQLGLRVESSDYKGTQNFTADSLRIAGADTASIQYPTTGYFNNQYPLSFFPSIFLTQKLTDNQDLQLSYTRRIDRPSFQQLFPFTDYADSLNLSRGNPNLKPQFTNSFELTYSLIYAGNANFLASAYYKNTTDLITRLASEGVNPVNNRPVIINTYVNAKSSFVGGLEFIARNSITRWWDVTGNINIFTSKINTIDTGYFAVAPIGEQWSYYAKAFNTFKITKALSFQLSGDFTSKTVLPPGGSAANGGNSGHGWGGTVSGNANGYNRPTGGVDAAIRYEFLKNHTAALTLSVQDIFRTRVSDVYTYSATYTQEYDRRRDPQFFRLQFNWRFGKFDMALFKRKDTHAEMDQGIQGGGAQN
jgi:outer membrane receptor protein involved in Fe transport